jgi:transmembrane sensor
MSDLGWEPSETVMREARAWVARLHSHEVDAAEANSLARWRNQSPAHEQAFAEANLRWTLFRSAALNVAARESVARFSPVSAALPRRIGRRAMFGSALAASAAGAACLALRPPLDLWPSISELGADYRTGTGQQRRVSLADTVSVEMNTQTSLSLRPGQTAEIEVISGEVVVRARSRAAAIAGGGRTQMEQGAFDLRHDESSVSVVCIEGEAQVACGGREAVLRPGQRVSYDDRGLRAVSNVDTGTIEAWRQGLLIFEEIPLSRVIFEINRYRHGRIILTNAALGTLPVDATFRLDRIDEAASRLADVFDVKIRSLPGGIVLLG